MCDKVSSKENISVVHGIEPIFIHYVHFYFHDMCKYVFKLVTYYTDLYFINTEVILLADFLESSSEMFIFNVLEFHSWEHIL